MEVFILALQARILLWTGLGLIAWTTWVGVDPGRCMAIRVRCTDCHDCRRHAARGLLVESWLRKPLMTTSMMPPMVELSAGLPRESTWPRNQF